ncbi:MAG: ATP-binding cassette domain-containing protein [Gemmatimonadales bacterium]
MLSARDLRVVRGNRAVLDVSRVELAAGTVTAILGPNGAGKSTLLSVLAFLEAPDAGALTLDGHQVRTRGEQRAARQRVTLVDQAPLAFRGTVVENLQWPHRARGAGGEVVSTATALGIEGLLSRDARTLSSGELQRLALARALLCRPAVLLLDEPTSAGDRTASDAVEAAITRARAAGVAVALASHRLGEAYRWSDRVLGLADGKLDTVTPENLFRVVLPTGTGVKAVACGALTVHIVTDRSGAAVLAVPPEDIVLSAAPLSSSARNTFPGRVIGIVEEGAGRLSVTVDAGTTLVARVTPSALRELGLTVGSPVVLSVKATAVRVL